jgi:hypothetical protein
LSNPRVLHSADDKSEIVIIFDATDTKKAKEFATSSDLKEVMTKAGVIDVPTMYFLESIWSAAACGTLAAPPSASGPTESCGLVASSASGISAWKAHGTAACAIARKRR